MQTGCRIDGPVCSYKKQGMESEFCIQEEEQQDSDMNTQNNTTLKI